MNKIIPIGIVKINPNKYKQLSVYNVIKNGNTIKNPIMTQPNPYIKSFIFF